ncbi:MAG: TIGR01459 family HAD-type hydrolase [Sphingomonadales bacterium]
MIWLPLMPDRLRLSSALPVTGLRAIASGLDALVCDVWGVLHDGKQAAPAALDCLLRARDAGIAVVLVSNTPKPGPTLQDQLDGFGIYNGQHYDDVATAGGLARTAAIAEGERACYHLGPDRDHAILDGIKGSITGRIEDADYILCTGFVHDDREDPDDYAGLLTAALDRGLAMICANPDLYVHVGEKELPCAGLLAATYAAMGGVVRYFGKPHGAIYDAALDRVANYRGGTIDPRRALAVGDGLMTDILGARRAGLPSLFITSGIHRDATGYDSDRSSADGSALRTLFEDAGVWPDHVMDHLVWED